MTTPDTAGSWQADGQEPHAARHARPGNRSARYAYDIEPRQWDDVDLIQTIDLPDVDERHALPWTMLQRRRRGERASGRVGQSRRGMERQGVTAVGREFVDDDQHHHDIKRSFKARTVTLTRGRAGRRTREHRRQRGQRSNLVAPLRLAWPIRPRLRALARSACLRR